MPGGVLEFQSETVLNVERTQLHIHEHFDAGTTVENDFIMRCWTPDEIAVCLSVAALDELATHTSYGDQDRAWSDRLVVVAQKRVPSHLQAQ